jgi:hypothetical protein
MTALPAVTGKDFVAALKKAGFEVARLGVADVRAFGLTWEDCEELLAQLGFSARIEIITA